MVDRAFEKWHHGQKPCFWPWSKSDHGQWPWLAMVPFFKSMVISTMVDHGQPCQNMVDHGQPCQNMVDHGQPWLTIVWPWLTIYGWPCFIFRLGTVLNKVSCTRLFCEKIFSFHTKMILAWFLWGSVLLRGEPQKYAKNKVLTILRVPSIQHQWVSPYAFKLEWKVFPFLKGPTTQFSATVIFTVFWDFTQRFLRNAISESAKISRVCLPISHRLINYEVFVKGQSNLTSRRFVMMNFTLNYCKNNDFHE